jgi:hypothetical protein
MQAGQDGLDLGLRVEGFRRRDRLRRERQKAPQCRPAQDSGSLVRRQEQLEFCFHRHEINESDFPGATLMVMPQSEKVTVP